MAAAPPGDSRHPRALRTLAVVELCYRLTGGAARGIIFSSVFSSWDSATSLAAISSIQNWLAILGMFLGGWLGDRYLGARRTAMLGGVAAAAGIFVSAIGSTVTSSLGLVALTVATVLIQPNLVVLVGRAYDLREPRRLSGFIWFDWASNVGTLLGLVVGRLPSFSGSSRGVLIALGFAMSAAVVVFVRSSVGVEHESLHAKDRSTYGRRVMILLALAVFALAAGFLVIPFPIDTLDVLDLLRPISALVLIMTFLIWVRRRLDGRTTGDVLRLRSSAMVVFGALGFWGFFALSSVYVVVGSPEYSTTPLWLRHVELSFTVALAPLVVILGRRLARVAIVPSAALAFAASFFLQTCAFIAVAIFARGETPSYWILAVYSFSALGDILVNTTGLNAVTALAPVHLSGRMVGLWHIAVAAGSSSGYYFIDAIRDSRLKPSLAITLAVCSLFVGLLFLPTRDALAGDAAYLASSPRKRAGTAALSATGVVAAVSIIWMVLGRSNDSNASVVAASAPAVFRGPAEAYLPDDPRWGFVFIEGGDFTVGADPTVDSLAAADETPATVISIPGFDIGKYEVTVAQYRQCASEAECHPVDRRALDGPDHLPVRHVSWTEALEYCRWLEKKILGLGSRFPAPSLSGWYVTLPSEAQWERAAGPRGGGPLGLDAQPTTYPWNGPLTPLRANYANSGRLAPVQVGEFSAGATADGLQDLSGNVAEWTRSEYRSYPYNPADGRDDVGSGARTRVIRGGSFYDAGTLLRITARQAADPNRGYEFVGFRVVIAQAARPPATTQ